MGLGGAFDGGFDLVGQYRLAEIASIPAGRERFRTSFIALAVMAMLPGIYIRDQAFQAICPDRCTKTTLQYGGLGDG
jgi:hypothetical protein